MKRAPRDIVVKTLFNADEFLEFDKACASADTSHSKVLRDLAKSFVASRNDRRRRTGNEWPVNGHNMSMLLPGRTNYGVAGRMNMRL